MMDKAQQGKSLNREIQARRITGRNVARDFSANTMLFAFMDRAGAFVRASQPLVPIGVTYSLDS